jgi:hypothetical protein
MRCNGGGEWESRGWRRRGGVGVSERSGGGVEELSGGGGSKTWKMGGVEGRMSG